MKNRLLTILAIGLLAGPMAAKAVVVTGYFQGTTYGTGSGLYADGTVVTMNFSYDTVTAPPGSCSTTYCDYYDFGNPVAWLTTSVTIGSDTYTFGDSNNVREVYVADSPGSDAFYVGQYDNYPDGSAKFVNGWAYGPYGTGEFLSGLAIPTSLDLTDLIGSFGEWVDADSVTGVTNYAYLNWTDLHLGVATTSVPEPSTLALLGLGLAGLGFSSRRKNA